ncbi:MAG: hypothetical protein ABSH09_34905, partial [Bryobacteraceae bacterium]
TVCPGCGSCLDRSYSPATLDLKDARRYDFGNTQDLQPLFSKPLVDMINDLSGQRLAANAVRGSRGYFHLVVTETVEFDAQRRKTKFGPPCDVCGRVKWIAGATPAFLICNQIPPNGIFRTDLEFGGQNGRAPLLILGKELKEKIESRRFPGIYFDDAYCAGDKYKADKVH